MNSKFFVWAACLLAAALLATSAEGESTGGTGGTSSTSVKSSSSTSTVTSITTTGDGEASAGGGGGTSSFGSGTSESSVSIEFGGPEEPPKEAISEEKPVEQEKSAKEQPVEDETAPDKAASVTDEEPAESSDAGDVVSETVSEDESQTTIARTDEEGTIADSVSVTTGGAGEGPVSSVAISRTSDEGAQSFAESSKDGSIQTDTVETKRSEKAAEESTAATSSPSKKEDEDEDEDDDDEEDEDEEDSDDIKELIPDLGVCEGLSKFLCCDDKDFLEENGKTFCGCWGSDSSQGCSFSVEQKENPLVVKDLRGLGAGILCKCPTSDAIENECFGRTRDDCCENVAPDADKCKCIFEDLCVYEKVSDGVWKDTLFDTGNCVCPPSNK